MAKRKRKNKKFRFWYWLTILIVFIVLCIFLVGIGFCYYIVTSAPEFDTEKMFEKEASRIFDSKGNIIATLGTEQRQKVTYGELPQVLVDAIIATEDSRFFQHNGFDAPRFLKASISQVLGRGGGGASTLTMQLSKLAFTSTESSGIQGIIRKFTDIYMSVFKLEKNYTKEEILEYYVNTPCMGGNIYGVEQASHYYFNKSVKDLNLVEAAMIAGMFQSPNGYNAYINPNDANARKNTVLYLMKRHGYITDTQYKAATNENVKIKNFLSEGTTTLNEYQGFIDTVVQEVIDQTGNNPYDVSMDIYSTMVKSKQNTINKFYKTWKFIDKKIEVGIGLVNTSNGEIMAVGAGRNKKGAMTLNVATFSGQTKRMPGSTIKPILDYGPAIEYANLSTYGPFIDEKTPYGGGFMRNFNGGYSGFMTMKNCLKNSINTCALQAFRMTTNEEKTEFAGNLGITFNESAIPESYAIGAFNGVSPVQLAGAYSAFSNGGTYNEPHSYRKIVYRDTEETVKREYQSRKAMKAQTAYIITNILTQATTYKVNVSGTQVATKTGTTSYDTGQLRKYGLSSSVIPDSWTSSYSPDYAMAIWYGYTDGLTADNVKKGYYLVNGHANTERLSIQGYLANRIYEKNSTFKRPSGIKSATVELETIPAQKPSSNTPSSLKGTFLFVSGTEPTTVSSRFTNLNNPINLKYKKILNKVTLSWDPIDTPDAINKEYLKEYFKEGYTYWADEYYNKRIKYNKNHVGNLGYAIYLTKNGKETYIGFTTKTSFTINLANYPGYNGAIVRARYSIFKSNASSGASISFTGVPETIIEELKEDASNSTDNDYKLEMNNTSITLKVNDAYKELNMDDINTIIYNNDADIKSEIMNANITLTSIKKNGSSSTLNSNQITKEKGTYTVTYKLTFNYLKSKTITKTITQNITVN